MVWEGHQWFGGKASQTVEVTLPLLNAQEAVSNTIPTTMVGGQSYPVTVTMKNTGSTTWTAASYIRLGARDNLGDSLKFGASRYYLPSETTVAPGEQLATFAFTMTAPTTAGCILRVIGWYGKAISGLEIQLLNR